VQSSGSWDEESDPIAEMNKSILPILVEALNFDIEKAAEECINAVNSGVSFGISRRYNRQQPMGSLTSTLLELDQG
jgi:hypothetical protein